MARTMAQRYKHLPPPQHRLGYIFAHDRITAGKALLIPQSLKNPAHRVPLLLVNLAVAFNNGIDPRHIWPKLLGSRTFAPSQPGRTRHQEALMVLLASGSADRTSRWRRAFDCFNR